MEIENSVPIEERNELEKISTYIDEQIPNVGMVFKSEEELHNYYTKYAYQIGFGVRKISIRAEGETKYYLLGCARGGKYVSKVDSSEKRLSSKTECQTKISVIVHSNERCTIFRVFLEYNHALSPRKSRFQRSHKKMDSYSKRRLELNDYAGILLNKNFHSLVVEARGYEKLPFGEKDCRNYIAKVRQLRLGAGDAEALRNYFVRMQRRNSIFFYVIDMDDEGRLRNVFWADARSRAAYESFRDVVSFDSTYLTNRYNMPFSPFVGVNHHGQSILFGCGLLSREDIEMYVWLFRSWLECMRGHAPKVIITNQCRSIQAAVAEVFPKSHHRLCLWHIMKKVPEKLGGLKQYKEIKKTLKSIVYDSMEPKDFVDGWSRMIEDYGLEKNEWLSSLFVDRGRWVPIYVKSVFWAGMSTTQRSESMNAFFDEYVNSKTSLRQFVEQYDNALKSKVEKENKADFDSFNSSYQLITSRHFEKQFQEAYTNVIFKLFQDELRCMLFCNFTLFKVDGPISIFNVIDIVEGKNGHPKRRVIYTVHYNDVEFDIRCSCYLFEFKGIICRHMAKILIEKDVKEIPSRYILTRWRKDVKHRHYFVVNCYDDLETSEQVMQFDNLYASIFEAAHIANSQAKYEFLMKWIDKAKAKLKNDLSWDDNRHAALANDEPNHTSDSSKKLLPPLQVRSKGRPPSRRKESKVDKIINKKKKNKLCGGKEGIEQDQVSLSSSKITSEKVSHSIVNVKETNAMSGSSIPYSYGFGYVHSQAIPTHYIAPLNIGTWHNVTCTITIGASKIWGNFF